MKTVSRVGRSHGPVLPAFVALVRLVLAPGSCAVATPSIMPQFDVGSMGGVTQGNQERPAVAAGGGGGAASDQSFAEVAWNGTNYLVAWADNRTSFTNNIYATRLSTGAVRLDPDDTCVYPSASAQTNPSVAWTGDNCYLTWQDDRNSAASHSDIYLGRLSAYASVIDPRCVFVSGADHPEMCPLVVASGADYGAIFYENLIYSIHRLAGRVCGERTASNVATIPELKQRRDGSRIRISDKVVTAGTDQLTGCFYIEEADRTSGIKVVSNDPVQEGDLVTVTGDIVTVDGERQIVATSVLITPQGGTVPGSLAMTVLGLGGVDLNAYTPGVKDGQGPNNIGLLVTLTGRVTSPGADHFYLDDGATIPGEGEERIPILVKVICPAAVPVPTDGTFVSATGISSCEPSGPDSIRRLPIRKTSDIETRPEP